MITVQVLRCLGEVILPQYATKGAAGADVRALLPEPLRIAPFERVLVPTGLYVAIPNGYEIQLRMRSGIALKKGLIMPNAPATIDSDYRGEIKVMLANLSGVEQVIEPNERIAQMVLAKHECIEWEMVEVLPPTVRNEGGFGSTGLG